VETTLQLTGRQRLRDPYKWLMVATGAVALGLSAYLLPMPRFDLRFMLLAGVMMLVSSRFSVQIPRVNTNVTVSDAFIFLILLTYGGLAGIILAGIEGFFSGLPVSKGLRTRRKIVTVSFNSAMMVCSTSLTVLIVRLIFGSISELRFQDLSHFIPAVGAMALIQYFSNTGISTIGLYLSYGIPLLLKLRAIRRGVWTARANGPWSLGNWSGPVNLIALLWIGFITVLFVLPPNELTGYIFGGALLALAIFYFVGVRGRFRGPVPQARSPAELLRLEAEFEK